eukprot:scaffold1307_cov200-Pinguiococcus_pyrenoidosus.AAC.138
MGEREHGAKGLCQERAFVSGLQAANSLMQNKILNGAGRFHQVRTWSGERHMFTASCHASMRVPLIHIHADLLCC